jgi:hypothetical protein
VPPISTTLALWLIRLGLSSIWALLTCRGTLDALGLTIQRSAAIESRIGSKQASRLDCGERTMDTFCEVTHARRERPGLNCLRGIGFTLLFGAAGFWGPIVLAVSFTVCRWWILGASDFDRSYDLHFLSTHMAFAVVAIGVVFASSGWATFAPRGPFRFTRTLIIIAAISVVSWIVLASLAFSLGLVPRKLKGDPVPLVDPLGVLLFSVAPTVTAVVLSLKRRTVGVPTAADQELAQASETTSR